MVLSPTNVDFSIDETFRILERAQEDSDYSAELPRHGSTLNAKPEIDSAIAAVRPGMIASVFVIP